MIICVRKDWKLLPIKYLFFPNSFPYFQWRYYLRWDGSPKKELWAYSNLLTELPYSKLIPKPVKFLSFSFFFFCFFFSFFQFTSFFFSSFFFFLLTFTKLTLYLFLFFCRFCRQKWRISSICDYFPVNRSHVFPSSFFL